MRLIFCGCALLAMAACSPPVPDSGAGVGFDNRNLRPGGSQTYVPAVPEPQAVSSETLAALDATAPSATGTTASTDGLGRSVVEASPSNPQPLQLENAGLSDEENFASVGNRRTIEDDARRRAAIASQYQVIEPTALPSRVNAGPNIVEYALSTNNPVGVQQYQRLGLNARAKFEKNCAKYPSAEEAQIDFLTRGGPQKDRLGLDPDGDGYACSWDPTPFRSVSAG